MDHDHYTRFMELAGAEFMAKTEALFNAKLASRGVGSAKDAPAELAQRLFREALMEVAVTNPDADFAALDRMATAMFNTSFRSALPAVLKRVEDKYDALEPAVGKDAAVVMAFLGVPVAPMDRKTGRIMAPLSNDIDLVARTFDRAKTAMVGYSTCEANFYVVLSDCGDSLARLIREQPAAARIAELFTRDKAPLPVPQGIPFRRACGLFRRYPGDQFAGFSYLDPRPDQGSVLFFAGWTEDGEARGAGGDGFRFVPLQLLHALLQMPDAPSFVRGDPRPKAPTKH